MDDGVVLSSVPRRHVITSWFAECLSSSFSWHRSSMQSRWHSRRFHTRRLAMDPVESRFQIGFQVRKRMVEGLKARNDHVIVRAFRMVGDEFGQSGLETAANAISNDRVPDLLGDREAEARSAAVIAWVPRLAFQYERRVRVSPAASYPLELRALSEGLDPHDGRSASRRSLHRTDDLPAPTGTLTPSMLGVRLCRTTKDYLETQPLRSAPEADANMVSGQAVRSRN